MDGEFLITSRDEGHGFNSEEVASPTTLENLLFTHGRGIYLMKRLTGRSLLRHGGFVVRMRKNSNGYIEGSRNQVIHAWTCGPSERKSPLTSSLSVIHPQESTQTQT